MTASSEAAIIAHHIMATRSSLVGAAIVGGRRLSIGARVPGLEARPFQHLPSNESRHADYDVGNAFEERNRECPIGRDAEDRAQHQQATLLGSEGARDGKGRAAYRVREALDHGSLG